ncbi:MAG: SGNH/GDSL hydrolase family protein [Candidatus Omnitrophica bacterium]|nr:SGNH/GDSL hydrolase family protein [Candidatus Omnitrophota bacterium]
MKRNIRDGKFVHKLVQTNSFGQRDSENPIVKAPNTVRVLAIGDSITFGHGVSAEDTYSERLERRLNNQTKPYHFDVINTGVPGNCHFQEYVDFRRGLIFKPDIAIIQFTINDVAEPYRAFARYGGNAVDYHRISDTCWLDNFLKDRSAFYLFLNKVAERIRYRSLAIVDVRRKAMDEQADLDWNAAADAPQDEASSHYKAWQECFKWLEKEAALCHENKIDCILFVSPHGYQLGDDSRLYAQKVLKEFATKNDMEFLDVLPLLRIKAKRSLMSKYRLSRQASFVDMAKVYPEDVDRNWKRFFLDFDHYNPEGHELVSKALYSLVSDLVRKRMENRIK